MIEPEEVMVIGGTYETPVIEGLLDEDFVETLKLQGTYAEDSFARESRLGSLKAVTLLGKFCELLERRIAVISSQDYCIIVRFNDYLKKSKNYNILKRKTPAKPQDDDIV